MSSTKAVVKVPTLKQIITSSISESKIHQKTSKKKTSMGIEMRHKGTRKNAKQQNQKRTLQLHGKGSNGYLKRIWWFHLNGPTAAVKGNQLLHKYHANLNYIPASNLSSGQPYSVLCFIAK